MPENRSTKIQIELSCSSRRAVLILNLLVISNIFLSQRKKVYLKNRLKYTSFLKNFRLNQATSSESKIIRFTKFKVPHITAEFCKIITYD